MNATQAEVCCGVCGVMAVNPRNDGTGTVRSGGGARASASVARVAVSWAWAWARRRSITLPALGRVRGPKPASSRRSQSESGAAASMIARARRRRPPRLAPRAGAAGWPAPRPAPPGCRRPARAGPAGGAPPPPRGHALAALQLGDLAAPWRTARRSAATSALQAARVASRARASSSTRAIASAASAARSYAPAGQRRDGAGLQLDEPAGERALRPRVGGLLGDRPRQGAAAVVEGRGRASRSCCSRIRKACWSCRSSTARAAVPRTRWTGG